MAKSRNSKCNKSSDGKHELVTPFVGIHHQKETVPYCKHCGHEMK